MSYDYNGTSDISKSTGSPVTATAFTMAGWIYSDSAAALRYAFGIQNSANNHGWRLGFNSTALLLNCVSSGGSSNGQAAGQAAANQWMHLGMVCSSATSRVIYKNGTSVATDTTNITAPASVNQIRIGAGSNSSGAATSYWDGRIAAVCLWNVALTASEMASLGAGAFPLSIRSGSVRAWFPLGGFYPHNGNDYWNGGYNLDSVPTVSGQEPRIYHIGWSGFTTKAAVVNSYSLTCTTQSATGTSNSATLKAAYKLVGTSQTATATVNTAGVNRTLTLGCTTQSASATSNNATLTTARTLAGTTQSGAGTANNATLASARTLTATAQSGTGTSNQATLAAAYAFVGTAQTGSATSNDATLTKTRVLACTVQAGTGTGSTATLAKASVIAGTNQAGTGTANDATLARVYSLVGSVQSGAGTPSDAQLRKSLLLVAAVQAAIATANNAVLTTDQPERDYSVLQRHTFTARTRTSSANATDRSTANTARKRSSQSVAGQRGTMSTARTRATEG